jgi:hypothetical protein
MSTRNVKEAEAMIRAHGLDIISHRRNRHHVYTCARDGRTFSIAVSASPSDFRWLYNLRQIVRHLSRSTA